MSSFSKIRCFVPLLVCLPFVACHKSDSSEDGPGSVTLALADSTDVKAEFQFPSSSWQLLSAPAGHTLEGASIAVSPGSFSRSLSIAIKESVPIVSTQFSSELQLSEPLSGDGRSVIFAPSDPVDAEEPMVMTIPWSGRRPDGQSNIVVAYQQVKRRLGGRSEIGFITQIEVGEKTVRFRAPYFGGYQVAFFAGDPAKINAVQTTRALLTESDEAANAPESFVLQTPTGMLSTQFPLVSWTLSKGASTYDLEIAQDKNCGRVVKTYRGIASLSRTVDGLGEGTYYACVSAVSEGGTRTLASNNGLEFSLSFSQLGVFQISSGRAFATAQPTLSWSVSQNAVSYQVQISSTAGCANVLETAMTKEPRFTLTSRRSDGTYWICIAALDQTGHKLAVNSDPGRPAGEGLSFIIDTTAPGQFDIKGVGGPSRAISWTLSSEALYYSLVVATDAECKSAVKRYENLVSSTGVLPIDSLTEGQSYFICASSRDSVGNLRVAKNSGKTFVYDTVGPKVTSVTTNKPSGKYSVGQTIDILVNFSEPTVCSSPTVQLSLNSQSVAKMVQGCGTATWLLRYTVSAGETADKLDYSGVSALALSPATVTDAVGNPLNAVLPVPGSPESLSGRVSIAIDTTTPSIQSVSPSDGAIDVAPLAEIVLVFSEEIQTSNVLTAVSVAKFADGSSVTGNYTPQFDQATKTLKLTPKSTAPLLAKTKYKLTVRGIKDEAQNEMLEKIFSFTTK